MLSKVIDIRCSSHLNDAPLVLKTQKWSAKFSSSSSAPITNSDKWYPLILPTSTQQANEDNQIHHRTNRSSLFLTQATGSWILNPCSRILKILVSSWSYGIDQNRILAQHPTANLSIKSIYYRKAQDHYRQPNFWFFSFDLKFLKKKLKPRNQS